MVSQDYVKSVECYTKSANQGNLMAKLMLGHCYEAGRGVPQDKLKAAEYYAQVDVAALR